ncbi:MAG: sigma 54-interacting transcriptional regulator [Spirochaetales bacterium]|nr:sigma 54-interacting transcriptional regulator [Spirochaetales bacterium]
MKQLLRSLEDYFSCTITYLTEDDPLYEQKMTTIMGEADIIPVYTRNMTEIFISPERLQHLGALLWRFPGRREFLPGELEHLLQCSRMIAMKLLKKKRDEEIHLYRQAVQLLGTRSKEGLVFLGEDGQILYQNTPARNRHVAERYREYNMQFEGPRALQKTEYSVSLEGTVPVQLDIKNLYSGDSYLGRIIFTRSGPPADTGEEKDRRYTGGGFIGILGKDPILKKTLRIAERAAETDTTVLLEGESGTGKEQFARAIHSLSARKNKPFVAINCAAIPEHLLESELFGYEEGAFTGASRGGKLGKIEAADSGTVFLDEIGDMPQNLQAKLLRVLQRREFERVGGTTPIRVNVRFISATHRDLNDLMRDGTFRSDLFYRLNVVPIHIPALREHREDVEILLNYYLKKYALTAGQAFKYFSFQAMKALTAYDWPGNIRELENVVQYCLTMSVGSVIEADDLPPGIVSEWSDREEQRVPSQKETESPEDLLRRLQGKRKALSGEIRKLLDLFGEDTTGKQRAAEHLNISLATLYRRLKEEGLV